MTTGLCVFVEYIKRLQAKFQQNKVNVCLRETIRRIARNPFPCNSIPFVFRSLFVLREYILMLVTSKAEINF